MRSRRGEDVLEVLADETVLPPAELGEGIQRRRLREHARVSELGEVREAAAGGEGVQVQDPCADCDGRTRGGAGGP